MRCQPTSCGPTQPAVRIIPRNAIEGDSRLRSHAVPACRRRGRPVAQAKPSSGWGLPARLRQGCPGPWDRLRLKMPHWQAALALTARPRGSVRWSGAVHLPLHLPLLAARLFRGHLAGRPCAGKSRHKKPRTQRMLASVWPASAWAAPLSERRARPTGHWQLDELSSARRGRWQLGTQQYQVLTTT